MAESGFMRDWRVDLPGAVWRGLGRLRLLTGSAVALCAFGLTAMGRVRPIEGLLLASTSFAFAATNAVGLFRRARRLEALSMISELAMNLLLVAAFGGLQSPLLFVFLVPVFSYGFRWGAPGACASASANTLALAGLAVRALRRGAAPGDVLPAALVCAVMWMEAHAVSMVVRALGIYHDELRAVAQTDPLTGLRNRRALYAAAHVAAQKGETFALVLVDLDGFKAVNDSRGHLFGDEVLKRAAGCMREALRQEDLLARYGGDEFAALVPGGRAEAETVLARLRAAVAACARELGAAVSLSGGVAVWPEDGATVEDVLRVADARLYAAKGRGIHREPETEVATRDCVKTRGGSGRVSKDAGRA